MNKVDDKDKLKLIKEAVKDWQEERLTKYSAMLIVSMIVAPKSELTREDVEYAKELESLARGLTT